MSARSLPASLPPNRSPRRPASPTVRRRRRATLALTAGASGALLFAADYPIHAWPLQLVAFLPLLWGLDRKARTVADAALAGAVAGVTYTGTTVWALEFPVLLGGVLAAYATLLFTLLSCGVHQVLRWPQPWGALAAGAMAAVVQWADFTLLPVWGTAQTFVRVWTAWPWAIQLVAYLGVTGVVFVVVALQALVLAVWCHPRRRRASIAALAALVGLVAVANELRWRAAPAGSLPVAAVGFTWDQLPTRTSSVDAVFARVYRPMVRDAVRRGARLVVSPEVGFWVTAQERAEFLTTLADVAREHRVWLAAGWFDEAHDDNRIAFVDDTGALRGVVRKTHLIRGIETYRAGDGELPTMDFRGVRLSGMICQDDNFTDLSRALGRRSVGLVAVPTNDWLQVKHHHLENSLFRPVESGYALVRAASNGISVIASPRGEVLTSMDHFEQGPGVIVADVPVGRGETLYSRLGDFWPLLCATGLLAGSLAMDRRRARRRRRRPEGSRPYRSA